MEKNHLQEMINNFQRKSAELAESHGEIKDLLDSLLNAFSCQQQEFDKISCNSFVPTTSISRAELLSLCLLFHIFRSNEENEHRRE